MIFQYQKSPLVFTYTTYICRAAFILRTDCFALLYNIFFAKKNNISFKNKFSLIKNKTKKLYTRKNSKKENLKKYEKRKRKLKTKKEN